jgi:hypothetical protein
MQQMLQVIVLLPAIAVRIVIVDTEANHDALGRFEVGQ